MVMNMATNMAANMAAYSYLYLFRYPFTIQCSNYCTIQCSMHCYFHDTLVIGDYPYWTFLTLTTKLAARLLILLTFLFHFSAILLPWCYSYQFLGVRLPIFSLYLSYTVSLSSYLTSYSLDYFMTYQLFSISRLQFLSILFRGDKGVRLLIL
jgi:hypothetical protein